MEFTLIEQEQIRREHLKAQKEAIINIAKKVCACGFVGCHECLFNIAPDRKNTIDCAATKE